MDVHVCSSIAILLHYQVALRDSLLEVNLICGLNKVAEHDFRALRSLAESHPETDYIAISHSDAPATNKWLEAVGGAGPIEVVVDHGRELYGQWGLGVSSFWHVLNPWSMSEVVKLGRNKGIWNRPTESGSRWQTRGSFGVDGKGVVRWVTVAKTSDDYPDFAEGLRRVTSD